MTPSVFSALALPWPVQIFTRAVGELRPHPSLIRHAIFPALQKTSALADRGEAAFSEPLTATQEGLIIDGYARWALAKVQGRTEVLCLTLPLCEEDALLRLLRAQHRSTHLNDFNRILLALELEDHFREAARLNQQAGGRNKLPSNVTELRPIDVRSEIAHAAGSSTGNVNNAKFLLDKAAPEVLEALKVGKIRIGRARKWLNSSRSRGLQELRSYTLNRQMQATSRTLLAAHPKDDAPRCVDPELAALLAGCGLDQQQRIFTHLLSTLPEHVIQEAVRRAGARNVC